MRIGILGLGKMGSRIALKLFQGGHDVVVWNRTSSAADTLKLQIKTEMSGSEESFLICKNIPELTTCLSQQKIIWCMLPAGEATENVLQEVSQYVQKGDILIDGGNAHFLDTQRRYEAFKIKGIQFLGIGVSGGVKAFDNGYPLMVGGDENAYKAILPILDSLSLPNGGYQYFGNGGAGHFVKMVHNAIEYGMMQAIGEGFGILEKAPYPFELSAIAELWQKGTIVSSFLMNCASAALMKDQKLAKTLGIINATGEAAWAIEEAKKEAVPVPVIEDSLVFRSKSQSDPSIQSSMAAKMVAALRGEFGGHDVTRQ